MGRLIKWLVLFLVVFGIAFMIWQKTRSKPVEVMVKPVTRGIVEKTVANTRAGTVDACRRARLSPSIGGQIAALPIHEGDQVKAGDLLLEIWNEDLSAQLAVAEQEAAVAKAQASAACQLAEEAERQAKRAQTLLKSKVNSQEQTDMAVSEALSLRAKCDASRASVLMSLAHISLSRTNLSRSRLIAPFSGIIAKIEGELSEYVTPSPVGVQTSPVVDLIENTCFYITAPIDEVDAAAVRVGMATRITLDAFGDRSFTGKVRRIAPYVLDLAKQARTVDIEVDFIDQGDFSLLLAGYSADVEIILDVRDNTLKVPSEAVMDGNAVYVLADQDNTISKRTFTAGLSNWAFTEVVSGLSEGARVVVNIDKPELQDGLTVVLAEGQP
ncbi:MAG: efflux RND transporter periplasmic adaptor subunit [Desulfocapsaceae bacterium]|jgi:HlyD family secretion protein|nr:efflux RND transporter periplasmic adaptor subunit [Desulfocapsaceae bacterium]